MAETRKKTRSRSSTPRAKADVQTLEIHQILNVLPHRYPLVMVDRVTELVAGEYARGLKCVSYNEPYFVGHFPTRPVMPGILAIESLSQLGAILAYVSQPFDPQTSVMYFLGIDNAKFRRMIIPGDRVDLYVEINHQDSNVWSFSVEATVDGTVCTEGELLASVVDR